MTLLKQGHLEQVTQGLVIVNGAFLFVKGNGRY